MSDYLKLERRFGLLTKYSVEELLTLDILGRKRLGWEQILAGRFSLITARANFGKTMELRAHAQRLRDEGKYAVFVALHRLLEEPDFKIALEATEANAFGAWEAASTERLHLFVDSLDEAVLGRDSGLQSALRRVCKAVERPGADVSWILSSRPATLTQSVLGVVQAELGATLYVGDAIDESPYDTSEEVDATDAQSARLSAFDANSTVKAKSIPMEHLKVFRLLPLSGKAAKLYLEKRHGIHDGEALLKAARRFGLSDLADGPGSLDVLAYVNPVSNPPIDLTSIFERMVSGVQAQQRSDQREWLVGRPSPESLDEAVATLAAASTVCQLPNMELAADPLKVRDGVLSCRPLVGSLLSESSLTYLLGSRLFIDSGQHQVKLYPEQLLPYLAAKRLSSLVQSPDDARRLIAALSWRAATGECGVHRAYLTVGGWLATFNVHCRLELLEVEPQAVAFFGDLRSAQVPLADASAALKRSLERINTFGDTLGRNHFTLTAENYWQVAKPGIESTLLKIYDSIGSDWQVRIALFNIATYARLDVFREKVLSEHGNDYAKLLGNSAELGYLMSLGREDDTQAIVDAAKASPFIDEGTIQLLLREFAWRIFDATTIAELASKHYMHKGDSFNLSWVLTHDVADSASPEQLVALAEALLSHMVKHFEAKRDEDLERYDNFADSVQELIALVVRAENLPVERPTQLCLAYFQAHGKFHFGSFNQAELCNALKLSDPIRQNLLRAVITESDRTSDGILKGFNSLGIHSLWQAGDAEVLAEPGFTELLSTLMDNNAAQKPPARTKKVKRDKRGLDERSKETLLAEVDSVKDGSNTNALSWIAAWLTHTNNKSRYGECDFTAFENAAGPALASAARAGLSAIWRKRTPKFNEAEPNTTYYVTVAGLQGLYLDLGNGANLPVLSESEVKQALSYGRFEINGYPKWFWSVVRAHEAVAAEEFRKVLAEVNVGAVSADKADALIRHIADAPPAVQRDLGGAAWTFATSSVSVDSYALEAALSCAVSDRRCVDQGAFEGEAWSRMSAAFRDHLPALESFASPANAEEQKARSDIEVPIQITRLRSNAVVWGMFWLTNYPESFGARWECWRSSEKRAAEDFMFELAAYVGQGRLSRLDAVAERGLSGLKTLSALYEWVVTVVREPEDIDHEEGRVYHVGPRDNAQRLRDSLLPAISSAKSQAAYEVLDELRRKATCARAKYIRHLQFQMREEEAHVAPVTQQNYPRFERDFAPPVTGFMHFAQTVHNDLLTVKREIEHGEFSLRRFFNRVVMKHIKTSTEGLALEEDFQALLGSELNHASGGRYGVTLEPILPEATRRDVLCQINGFRATVELKMSERWTVADYLVSLEEQLKGQYMQDSDSKIGFFVVVLQRHDRKWSNPKGGDVDFAGLIGLLETKALELQAADPALFLRIVGIDATPQADFRESMAATKAAINGPAQYADERGNTWSGKGRRPKWLNDALATGKTLADFVIGGPTA